MQPHTLPDTVPSEQDNYDALLSILPPVIARKDIERLLGGTISRGHLANLDWKGEGPPKIQIGRYVSYLRGPFLAWLKERHIKQHPIKKRQKASRHVLD